MCYYYLHAAYMSIASYQVYALVLCRANLNTPDRAVYMDYKAIHSFLSIAKGYIFMAVLFY